MITKKNTAGFTLIELMIVVAILAILTAIAIPNFQQQAARAKRMEAISAMELVFHAEYAHFATNDTYVMTYRELGLDTYIKTQLKYYRIPSALPNGFNGCWVTAMEICVFPAGVNIPRTGFIAALSGNIDGKIDGQDWFNEDAVFVAFGNVAPYYPPELQLGTPQVYHSDFFD